MDSRPADRSETDPDKLARLEALFEQLAELDGEARVAALADAARLHPDIHDRVTTLLAAHDRLSAATGSAGDGSHISIGTRIGGYRVVDRIGQGGMGEVFRAERADGLYAAEVAIKTTHTNLARPDLVRRFDVERRILALLRHPNIVTLLDGGATDSGQAYLIMEHVRGEPLTQYCRAKRLSLADRLKIFRAIADGVQHAHQHGVVHRDLKPANVLVDADGVPKILDFGVAKLLDDSPGSGSTTKGVIPGPLTPNYASPEQLRGLPVTTASDIYALGVMLYELVSGHRPYETDGHPLDRMLEIVVHDETKPPSTVAVTDGSLPYSSGALRGDVDAIVMKAMHKDAAGRYGSAAELSADIGRSLAGDPIVARAPSAGYVLRRVAARHKPLIAMTCVALVAILAALGVAIWQRQIARREQARAEQRFQDLRRLANTLIFKIHDAVTPLPGSTPVRRTIVDEATGYLERLEAESAGDVRLQLELASAYRQLGSILGDPARANLGDRAGARRMYERSLALVTPLAHNRADADVFEALVDSYAALSTIERQHGSRPRAIELARESLAHARRFDASQPGHPRADALVARASFMLATHLSAAESRPVWEETLSRYEKLLAASPGTAAHQRNVALVEKYLGTQLENARELSLARTHYARALELDRQRLAAAPTDQRVQFDAAISFAAMGSVAEKLNEYDAAAGYFEQSLVLRRQIADADPRNMQARHRLGYLVMRLASVSRRQGHLAQARSYAAESINVLQQVHAATGDRQSQYDLAWAWVQQARAAESSGDRATACASFRQAERQYGDPSKVLASDERQDGYLAELTRGLERCR